MTKINWEERANRAYYERNNAVILAAKLALTAGLTAGTKVDLKEGWDEEWCRCVYIELPDGRQLSWHIHPDQIHLLEDLPEYKGEWDGTWLSRSSDFLYGLTKALTK